MNVKGRRITVFGMAKSGLSLCRLLSARGASVRASDARPIEELGAASGELESLRVPFVVQGPEALADCEIAALSPGVPPDLTLFEEARSRGIHVTGDVELAAGFLRGPILGITGSNGKTTTTALAGHLLNECGVACQVGGNIGTPLASMVESSRDGQWNVLELSSFQLEMVRDFHAAIAVALNVTPDHLDRHHTFESYAAAKSRLFLNQTADDAAVLNAEDAVTRGYAALTRARIFHFHAGEAMARGFSAGGGDLLADGRFWMPASEVPLRGRHNIENVLAAACAAHLAGADLDGLRRAVHSFSGVEHRIEFVRSVGGVDWFNDSKATNVDATIKALLSFESGLWVILGGKDKHSDYSPLTALLLERARAVLLIGAATEIIAAQIEAPLAGRIPLIRCGDLRAAVTHAAAHARPGDTVLLAPACASFDQFQSYEHRGRVFKSLVAALDHTATPARTTTT